MDLSALEKLGRKVYKYDFAPHQAVIETTNNGSIQIQESFKVSCKRAGGQYCIEGSAACRGGKFDGFGGYFSTDGSVFRYMFEAYKRANEFALRNGKAGSWQRCVLPKNEIIEMTRLSDNGYNNVFVIQNNDDREATKPLIKAAKEKKQQAEQQAKLQAKQAAQSVADDWLRASETLRKSLKSGDQVWLILENNSGGIVLQGKLVAASALVIDVKPPLAHIQLPDTSQPSRWQKMDTLYAKFPDMFFCGRRNSSESDEVRRKYIQNCLLTSGEVEQIRRLGM